jgi:hypothetical protein
MGRRPTTFSVTDDACACGYLERAAAEETVPIVFDPVVNEYHILHVSEGGGYSVIYHCPFCGGATLESRRDAYFAQVTTAEAARLRRLTAGIQTVLEARNVLGPPDRENPTGLTITTPESEDGGPMVSTYPTLTYTRLSDTADVTLVDYGPLGVRFTFQGKFLGKPSPEAV